MDIAITRRSCGRLVLQAHLSRLVALPESGDPFFAAPSAASSGRAAEGAAGAVTGGAP